MKHFYDRDLLESEIFGDLTPEPDGEPPGFDEDLEEAGEEPPADLVFTLTLEDGSQVSCRAAGIFMENDKEYIALEMGGDEIQIMALAQGEDDSIFLLPPEDDAEKEAAFQAFLEIVGTEKGEDYDRDQNGKEN